MIGNGKGRTTPSATYRVEVTPKTGFSDPAGASVLAQLPTLGVQTATEVRVGTLYEIAGPLSLSQLHSAAQGLLADPITQDFIVSADAHRPNGASAPYWRIEVWLKRSVTDPAGESVRKAVTDLGLPAPERVRCGTVYRIFGRVHQAQAEKIAVKLLANPVVHQYSVAPS